MRKTLLFLAIVFSASLMAQQNSPDGIQTEKVIKQSQSSDKSQTPIWSEDFGNGFPSGWSTYTSNTGSGNNGVTSPGNTAECPWKHSMNGSWGYWNSVGTNPQGNPTGPASPISSTTAANGFLISDPDSANHWNGNSGSNSGSTYHYIESYFTTSAIDLSGYSNVSLEFQQTFRFNNGLNLKVSISTDNMMWTDYNVQGNATNNQQSPNPQFVSLNISSIAGNSSTVYIRIGWEARVYYWMIDDMQIVETPDHKLKLTETNYGGWYTNSPTTTNSFGLEHSLNPIAQVTANPYEFSGIVANAGALDQTTQLNAEVFNDIGVSVFTTNSSDSVISALDTTTFVCNSTFTPPGIGVYFFNTWAVSDSTITDIDTNQSIVTDSIYGRDNNVDISEYGLGRSCGGMVIGTYFDVYMQDDVTSISVFIKDNSVAGAIIYASLYEIDLGTTQIWLTQSDDYTLQQQDLGNWVTISFPMSYNVSPGSYMAAVGGYAHPLDTSIVGMSQYTFPATCFIQKNGCLNSGQTFGNWYWMSRVPMIRMNFGTPTTAVNENNLANSIKLYPNPATDKVTIDLNNQKSESFNIKITNVLGQVVFSDIKDYSIHAKQTIDVSAFVKGVYLLEIINSNEKSFFKKIVVE